MTKVWSDHQIWSRDAGKQDATTPMAADLVVAEFIARKKDAGASERYVDNTSKFFMRFFQGREKKQIHEIKPDELASWISAQAKEHGWSLSTKYTYQSLFSSLWEVAIAKGWATLNITGKLEPIKVPGK